MKSSVPEKKYCRICFEEGSDESLISPCRCKGSMREVHARCMEHWVRLRNQHECEVCHAQLNLKLKYPSFLRIGFEVIKSLWSDKPKLLKLALLAIYGQFLYRRLMSLRLDFTYLARSASRNWYKMFLVGVVFGIYYAQLVFIFFKEGTSMVRDIADMVHSTARISIGNYYC